MKNWAHCLPLNLPLHYNIAISHINLQLILMKQRRLPNWIGKILRHCASHSIKHPRLLCKSQKLFVTEFLDKFLLCSQHHLEIYILKCTTTVGSIHLLICWAIAILFSGNLQALNIKLCKWNMKPHRLLFTIYNMRSC